MKGGIYEEILELLSNVEAEDETTQKEVGALTEYSKMLERYGEEEVHKALLELLAEFDGYAEMDAEYVRAKIIKFMKDKEIWS